MNKVTHFEIPTKHADRAKDFYKKLFGWKIIPMEEMNYTIVHTGPTDDKGMVQEKGFINGGMTVDDKMAKNAIIVIEVDSIDQKLKEIISEGGKEVMPKTDVGDMGYYARFKDTEDNVVGLWENK